MKVCAVILFIVTLGLLVSCDSNESPATTDSFDRSIMLEDWADLMIIPSLESFSEKINVLAVSKNIFINEPSAIQLNILRESYLESYKAWQKVAMFDIGKAEQIGFRNFMNIYPTDNEKIESYVNSQSFDLALPSNFAVQGFPALDYLLFGLAEGTAEGASVLSGSGYSLYLAAVVDRMVALTDEVLTDWNTGYRTTFVNNDGASATASVDKMVNDYLYYFERFLRAGKVGLPAGVFSGDAMPAITEAPYSKVYSKELFLESLDAANDFFIGNSFDGTVNGTSLEDYLLHLEGEDQAIGVSQDILEIFTEAATLVNLLPYSFYDQVLADNMKMLEIYDALQKAVVIMKVDMMQALNIQVDYVDADGD